MSDFNEKIDELIEERAQWLFQSDLICIIAKFIMLHLLNYNRTIKLAREFEHRSASEIFSYMGNFVSKKVHVEGLQKSS